jgi:hypothetical protein
MIGLGKTTNEYANRIDSEIEASKAVWMAIAVSLANLAEGGGLLDMGQLPTERLLAEWQALHDNGIVQQKPRRR